MKIDSLRFVETQPRKNSAAPWFIYEVVIDGRAAMFETKDFAFERHLPFKAGDEVVAGFRGAGKGGKYDRWEYIKTAEEVMAGEDRLFTFKQYGYSILLTKAMDTVLAYKGLEGFRGQADDHMKELLEDSEQLADSMVAIVKMKYADDGAHQEQS